MHQTTSTDSQSIQVVTDVFQMAVGYVLKISRQLVLVQIDLHQEDRQIWDPFIAEVFAISC